MPATGVQSTHDESSTALAGDPRIPRPLVHGRRHPGPRPQPAALQVGWPARIAGRSAPAASAPTLRRTRF